MTKPRFNWPLATSPFTVRDRLRIGWWLLTQDRYTMGEKVRAFESAMADRAKMECVAVSSGSAANELLFQLLKFEQVNKKLDVVVIAPAVTWSTSITPILHAGFELRLCDINLKDFSFDYDRLEEMLKRIRNHERNKRVIIWPTALIGFVPRMGDLKALAKRYTAELYLDACENTLSEIEGVSILGTTPMATTSCFFSHQVVAIEFGFFFAADKKTADMARMWRNHGMSRILDPKNPLRQNAESHDLTLDPSFLFAVPGGNLRPSEVHAMFGLLDLARAEETRKRRNHLYRRFSDAPWDPERHWVPTLGPFDNAYCLPVFTKWAYCRAEKDALRAAGIEVRPIVGGNLARQPFLRGRFRAEDFPNAEFVHRRGFYVGLHHHVTEKMIDELARVLIEREV